jgi:hypothetical protein
MAVNFHQFACICYSESETDCTLPQNICKLRVTLNLTTFDDCVRNGVDIYAFLALLDALPDKFDQLDVTSSWGLILFSFYRAGGQAKIPVSVDVLKILDGTVLSDSGRTVSRWQRLAEELLKYADERASGSPVLSSNRKGR